MRIRQQLLLLSLVPLIGVSALAKLGVGGMNSMSDRMETVIEGDFNKIVNQELPSLTEHRDSIALLLNGDRDAYQAFVAEREILMDPDSSTLATLKETSSSNRAQVIERTARARRACLKIPWDSWRSSTRSTQRGMFCTSGS